MKQTAGALISASVLLGILATGCVQDTSEIEGRVVKIEKRLRNQDKQLKELSSKFLPQKDFSADIQRLEEQQDRISELLKTRLEPVNSKLEEFRDWARDAQNEQVQLGKKISKLDQNHESLSQSFQKLASDVGKLGKEINANRARFMSAAKSLRELSKVSKKLTRDMDNNNARLVKAIKKTLPKVKTAAVADMRNRLIPLEKELAAIKSSLDSGRKASSNAVAQRKVQARLSKQVQALTRAMSSKVNELEDIVTAHKNWLLDVRSKVHKLEQEVKQLTGN